MSVVRRTLRPTLLLTLLMLSSPTLSQTVNELSDEAATPEKLIAALLMYGCSNPVWSLRKTRCQRSAEESIEIGRPVGPKIAASKSLVSGMAPTRQTKG
jgi:hypothetical protein